MSMIRSMTSRKIIKAVPATRIKRAGQSGIRIKPNVASPICKEKSASLIACHKSSEKNTKAAISVITSRDARPRGGKRW